MTSTPKPKQPKTTAAHRRLEVFIGNWHAEGTSYGDGQDAADPRAAHRRIDVFIGNWHAKERPTAMGRMPPTRVRPAYRG
jgi:hypothetical protein